MEAEKYLKAIYGAVVAGLGALATAYVDNVISGAEWIAIALVTLTAFGAVWGVKNAE